jgi:hypothetical protein
VGPEYSLLSAYPRILVRTRAGDSIVLSTYTNTSRLLYASCYYTVSRAEHLWNDVQQVASVTLGSGRLFWRENLPIASVLLGIFCCSEAKKAGGDPSLLGEQRVVVHRKEK